MKHARPKPAPEPVRAVRYTQAQGFSDIEDLGVELGIELADGCEVGAALIATGWVGAGHPYCLEHSGDSDFTRSRTYRHKTGNKFVVDLDLHDTYEFVLVEGRGNLMALRVALAPLIQLGLFEKLMTTGPDFAVRTFLHEYRHEPWLPCKTCETDEERTERKGCEERMARKRKS